MSVNANGWPVNISGESVADYPNACVKVWENIMQNPPTVAISDGTAITTDYLVTVSSGASSSLTGCTYQYQGDSTKSIAYDASTGKVTIND